MSFLLKLLLPLIERIAVSITLRRLDESRRGSPPPSEGAPPADPAIEPAPPDGPQSAATTPDAATRASPFANAQNHGG